MNNILQKERQTMAALLAACRKAPLGFALAILLLISNVLNAQTCCVTGTLPINTGYNPATDMGIPAPTANGITVPDLKWRVTYESPSFIAGVPGTFSRVIPPGAADVIMPLAGAYVATPLGKGGWISALNANYFSTDGAGPVNKYKMTFQRTFCLCSDKPVPVRLVLDLASDNYIESISIDGNPPFFSQSPVASADHHANYDPTVFYNTTLGSGCHTLNITVVNYNHPWVWATNWSGLNVYGRVITPTGPYLIKETPGCTSYVCSMPSISGCNKICNGATTSLTGTPAGGTWSTGPWWIASITPGGVYTPLPWPTGSVATVTYTNSCGQFATYPVTMNPVIAPITVGYPNKLRFCQYSTINLYDATPGGSWLSLNPSVATVGASSGSVYGLIPGTAEIRYVMPGSPGCPSCYKNIIVTVNPSPVAPTVTYTGCNPACPGSPLTYTLHGTPGSKITYSWTDPAGTVITASVILDGFGNGPVTLSGSSTGTVGSYTLTIISAYLNPCTTTIGARYIVKVVAPKGSFTGQPKASVCAGYCYTLTCTAAPGTTEVYVNTVPASGSYSVVPIGPSGTGTLVVCPTVTTVYQVVGAGTGCCTYMYSGSVMTLVVIPPLAMTLSVSPSPVCPGAPIVLSGTCVPSSPYYDWGLPPGSPSYPGISTLASPPTLTDIALPGTYTLTGYNQGCPTTVSVNALLIPVPAITCKDTVNPATGECVPYYESSVYPVTINFLVDMMDISWVVPGCYAMPMTMTVTGPIMLDACTLYAQIPPSCSLLSLPCTSLHINLIKAVSTVYMGCKNPASCIVDPNCPMPPPKPGVRDVQVGNTQITVVPNPTTGNFELKGTIGTTSKDVYIEITDVLGKVVYTDKATVTDGKIDKKIMLGDENANGLYLVRVKNDDVSQTIRFTLKR